ncbi:hypothetical protein GCM10027174_09280 [Salinifilum aidingensis]
MEQAGRVEGLMSSLASPKAAFAGRDAELESLVGQIFLVALVAWLVSAFRRRGSDPAAPSSPTTARFSTARIVLAWRSDR